MFCLCEKPHTFMQAKTDSKDCHEAVVVHSLTSVNAIVVEAIKLYSLKVWYIEIHCILIAYSCAEKILPLIVMNIDGISVKQASYVVHFLDHILIFCLGEIAVDLLGVLCQFQPQVNTGRTH